MTDVVIYTKGYCSYCAAAKSMLEGKDMTFTEIDVQNSSENFSEMVKRSNRRTVPQIFFGEDHIGGHADLVRHFK